MKIDILSRPQIDAKLEIIFSYPMTIVHGTIGYGKTTAVREFLKGKKCAVAWVSLADCAGSIQRFWHLLTKQLAKAGLALGESLKRQSFPSDPLTASRIIDLLLEEELDGPIAMVFDDFHLLEDKGLFDLTKRIAEENIKNLHIVIVTRDLSKLNAAVLYQKGLLFTITEKSLRFTKDEVAKYLRLMNCHAQERDLDRIYQLTGGWISMVTLIVDGMLHGLPIEKNDTVKDLIEQNIYGLLAKSSKDALVKLSFFDVFTMPMAVYVLEDDALFMDLAKEKSLLTYNEVDKTYRIHNLLLEYLGEKVDKRHIDQTRIFTRAGEWHLAHGQRKVAFDYLRKADRWDLVFSELDQESLPDSPLDSPGFLQDAFAHFDLQLQMKHPVAYLRCIRALALSNANDACAMCWDMLAQMEENVKQADLKPNHKSFLLGEINTVWMVVDFNDIHGMLAHGRKALSYFSGGGSRILSRGKEFCYGSPHLLFLYHKEPGSLRLTKDLFVQNSHVLASAASGYGIGCDSVAEAEYCLETGDWDNVELHAYKAMHKARYAGQLDLLVCANFTLARLALLKGKKNECLSLMDSLRRELYADSQSLSSAFELCTAYLSCILGITEGLIIKTQPLIQGRPFHAIVQGMTMLSDPIRLDAHCETSVPIFQRFNNQLGLIRNGIHEAIAKDALHKTESALKALESALSIAHADHIIAPFAESAPQISHLLKLLPGFEPIADLDETPAMFLDNLKKLCPDQKPQDQSQKPDISLTARETEILSLLEAGFKHAEIGSKLYISVTTVRYHIQNVYQKLEVNNKVLAIRKAKSLRLI
ncbi:MAG: LuxR C-terminal-related transcriptional regulator [Clostridiales bacterium]|nr:LuxR C-terminal-related transcriptional regulator [Clostridiales bacterium]